MFWLVPTLFGLFAALLVVVFCLMLRDAEDAYVGQVSGSTARQLEDLFLFIPPHKLLRMTHLLALLVFGLLLLGFGEVTSAGGWLRGCAVAVPCAALVYLIPGLFLKLLRRRRLARFNNQLADALNGMSNALRAGFSIQQAFETVVEEARNPIAQEFGMLLQQVRVGVTFEQALEALDERIGSDDLTLMVQSIAIARQTGGNLTEVFDRIAETLRERRRVEGKIKAMTALGRIQGQVVGAMPILLGLVLYMLDPPMMQEFLQSAVGLAVIAVVLVLEVCGAVMIHRIVNIDV